MTAAYGSRVAHWLRCPNKTCCSYYIVYPTGDDLARIARTIAVPPWTFTATVPCQPNDVGAFALDNTTSRYRLALVRTAISSDESAEPSPSAERSASCTFLVRAADGAARCGLGPGRPASCRSFPAQLIDGRIAFETSGCTCDWSQVSPAQTDADLLRAEEQARKTYTEIIASWNDYVGRMADGAKVTHQDFCRYLMDAYSPTAA